MLVVYSKNNCPECAKAAALLDTKGVQYYVVKADENPHVRAQLMEWGHRSVPQVYTSGHEQYLGDYRALIKLTDEQWATLK
jgi:glutaredoxin